MVQGNFTMDIDGRKEEQELEACDMALVIGLRKTRETAEGTVLEIQAMTMGGEGLSTLQTLEALSQGIVNTVYKIRAITGEKDAVLRVFRHMLNDRIEEYLKNREPGKEGMKYAN